MSLTIVTYHYVRSHRDSRFPGINALDASVFREQLDYIQRNFQPVTVEQVVAALDGNTDSLPKRPLLLTFDDGYIDHYTEVFPLLFDRNLSGAFFAPMMSAVERRVLDVNKVHYILASGAAAAELIEAVENKIRGLRTTTNGVGAPEQYSAEFERNAADDRGLRFDAREVVYLKRLLQHLLPDEIRGHIVDELFAKYVTEDEEDLAAKIYATVDQLRVMRSCGMYVGPHGTRHRWLNHLSRDEQADEIDRSLDILSLVGASRSNYAYCYPYGGYNADTLALLEQRGCALALSTKVGIAEIERNSRLHLPRIDCRDIPTQNTVRPLC